MGSCWRNGALKVADATAGPDGFSDHEVRELQRGVEAPRWQRTAAGFLPQLRHSGGEAILKAPQARVKADGILELYGVDPPTSRPPTCPGSTGPFS